MSWLFQVALALVIVLLLIAIVRKLVKLALLLAVAGLGGLAIYWVFMAAAPPHMQDALQDAKAQAVKVGEGAAQATSKAVQAGGKALEQGGKAVEATQRALDDLKKKQDGTATPEGEKKP